MERLQKRKLPRLQGYDYSKNGAYFLTLCARDKAHLFGRVVGTAETSAPANARIPRFVSTLKRMTNRAAGLNLWQRSFHDHIIRDGNDYLSHWTYINGNPALWAEDEYYTA